ncbi:MAG: hypothetical protein KGH57_01975 [Candidatus Micrarchaeota archaeon]|nr:hypothetical protein [Candidatus Micrarchaeota archaeon]
MSVRATKQTIGDSGKAAADLLSETGRTLREDGVITGFQVNSDGSEWVTAVYKIVERPRTLEVRISPKAGKKMLGIMIATLLDNYGDFVAGITGPIDVTSGSSPDDLKTKLVDSLLHHSLGDMPEAASLGIKTGWRGVFLAAIDAREKAQVVREVVKNGRNRRATRRRHFLRVVAAS